MDFGKDEVTVSSAITAPLHCFLLNLNAAARSEKKTKKQNKTTHSPHWFIQKLIQSRVVQKTHLQDLSKANLHKGKQELHCNTNRSLWTPYKTAAMQCRFYTARKH